MRFIDDKTAALIGRIVILEEQVAELIARADKQEKSRGFGPGRLLSEPQAAEALGVSTRTLSRWRQSSRPPIPVVMREGFIRYSAEDIDRFIREGKRGAKPALRVA